MRLIFTTLLITCLTSLAGAASAEVIKVPIAQQAQEMQSIEKPRLGMKQDDVQAKFGDPLDWSGPVGEPPITRWEYADYYVFFEHDIVLHTVLKHRPKGPVEQ